MTRWEGLREYGIFIILMLLGLVGLAAFPNSSFAQALSLYVFKPGLLMLMVGLVAQFAFRKIDFQEQILDRNVAAALVFLGICIVVAGAL